MRESLLPQNSPFSNVISSQATAYPVLIGSATDLFKQSSGMVDEHVATMIIGMVVVVSAGISIAFSKRFNRKTLLVSSALGVSLNLFILGTFYYIDGHDLQWIPIAAFVCYIFCFMVY